MSRSSHDRSGLPAPSRRGGRADARLNDYLRRIRQREVLRTTLRFVCALVSVMLVVTAIGVAIGLEIGFAAGYTQAVRAALVVGALALVPWLLWRPLRALRRDRGVELVERSDGAFDGRIRTWDDARTRTPGNPFLPILARDGLSIARRVPPNRVVRSQELVLPLVALLLAAASIVLFVQRAPDAVRDAGLHVWWGWYQDGLVEPRALAVAPGDAQLLAGEHLEIEARLSGFEREAVALAVRPDGGQWQETEIRRGPDGVFRYTLFSLDTPLEYRVSAGYLDGETYTVAVTVPPRVLDITADYRFPDWTRLEDRRDDNVGNLVGVRDTEIDLAFETDRPIEDGFLEFGDRRIELGGSGTTRTATVRIREDGEYRLMARLLGREVPLTPAQGVILRGDDPPDVRWTHPGRDVSATPVEEVRLGLVAEDDFAVESIELLYSVNAGDWQTIALESDEQASHVFMLESMGLPPADGPSGADGASPEVSTDGPADQAAGAADRDAFGVPLEPGDLVSYYARVRDRDTVVETDMMLIDVRPFDRRFSEGDAGGGGGGGGGGANEGSEISKRQKEILIATWNLQRAREADGAPSDAEADNAALLAELQMTLAEQARTLADRSEARELVQQGDEIRRFVEYLRAAADTMEPSAERLSALDFDAAIQPQQRALQLLQRAEALFADIRVTRPGDQSGGGGSQPGQDMAEMFELEMDLERNQYERPDRGQSQQSPAEAIDDVFEELAELARRQQALDAARESEPEPTQEQAWEQAQLERDLAELQSRLDAFENGFGSDQLVEGTERDAADVQRRDRDGERATAETEAALREATEQLEAARAALESQRRREAESATAEAGADPSRSGDAGTGDSGAGVTNDESVASGASDSSDAPDDSSTEGTPSAAERIAQALEVLAGERSRDLERGILAAADAAAAILDEQRETERLLREAVERAQRAREAGQLLPGLDREAAHDLAERKRALQRDLEVTRGEVTALVDRFEDAAPRTTEALRDAVRALDRSQIAMMLGLSGDAIENGSLATALPGESLVTNGAREWRDRLREASDVAAGEELQRDDAEAGRLANVLDELRRLRQALAGGGDGPVDGGQAGDLNDEQLADASASTATGPGAANDASGESSGRGGSDAQSASADSAAESGSQSVGEGQAGESGGDGQTGASGQEQAGEQREAGGQGASSGQSAGGAGSPAESGSVPSRAGGAPSGRRDDAGYFDLREGGTTDGFARPAVPFDPEIAADRMARLLPDLEALGASADDLDALTESIERFRRRGDGTGIAAERLEREYANAQRLIEQLELELGGGSSDLGTGSRGNARQSPVPELSAEYYRRLSEGAREP